MNKVKGLLQKKSTGDDWWPQETKFLQIKPALVDILIIIIFRNIVKASFQ